MGKCQHEGCKNQGHHLGEGYCALHCEKSIGSRTEHNSTLLVDFYNELVDYVISILNQNKDQLLEAEIKTLKSYRNKIESEDLLNTNEYIKLKSYLSNKKFFARGFRFPRFDDRHDFYYPEIISLFGGVHFNSCCFYSSSSGLKETEISYDQCKFYSKWNVDQLPMLRNIYGATYHECEFYESVNEPVAINLNGVEQKKEIYAPLFSDCKFFGKIIFFRTFFHVDPFRDVLYLNGGDITFRSCELNGGLFLSDPSKKKLGKVVLKNCSLKGVFSAKSLSLKSLIFENCEFSGHVLLSNSSIDRVKISTCTFGSLLAFNNCTYYGEFFLDKVNLNGMIDFREAKFLGGLNLDTANFSGEANFLGVDADGGNIANTTRETYRLIKHSFDNIGNHLEANKFFAKEMDKYRDEVSGNKSLPWWDRAVFHINKNVSDFGQNYLLSIGWLLLFMVGYFYTFVLHRHFGLIHNESSCDVFDNGYDKVNCLASGMIPFKGFLTNGMELLSLFFYIIFAVLVWQTVVALKRHTRR